jgi:putative nucleotidyltransferase with HDIG domain
VSAALDIARAALRDQDAWVVGGAVRDRLLGREVRDVDVAVADDPRAAARRVAVQAGGPAFELSGEFGAWRVMAPDRSWQLDVAVLQGASIEEDLARRDFTINAIAEPLGGGPVLDPHGGVHDAHDRRLRMVAARAFDDDPLRVLRLARLATELGLEVDDATLAAARGRAPGLARVAAERIFAELKRLVGADAAVAGLRLCDALAATEQVLPELHELHGVGQSRYHHLDVHGHTLEALQAAIDLERDPGAVLGAGLGVEVAAWLAAPLADELTRGGALRWGCLLHDAAKPQTRRIFAGGHVGFPDHDTVGAQTAREVLTRLHASERLRAHVAALTRHHLRLGFLVRDAPLDRRATFRYLVACEPVEVDVTLLTVCDRLATRGRKGDEAIAAHLALARDLLRAGLDRRAAGRPEPLVRGDVLARELGIAPGPALGPLLAEIEEARYAGEVASAEDAVALARRRLA